MTKAFWDVYSSQSIFLTGMILTISGCATIGTPRMIAPNTYTIVGSGSTNALHNMEDKFLEGMQNHCQSLGKYPLVRKNNVHTQVINAFGDKTYDGSLIYECIDAAEYSKSKQHFDEVTPIQRIENRVIIEHQ
jgi:hypothetical protein